MSEAASWTSHSGRDPPPSGDVRDATSDGPVGSVDELAVRVEVPARPEYLRYVRLAAAAMGNDVGYSVATIEAMRTAVHEQCAIALEGAAPEATLVVTMAMDSRRVGLVGSCGPVVSWHEPDGLAIRILDELAFDHGTWVEDEFCRFRMQFVA